MLFAFDFIQIELNVLGQQLDSDLALDHVRSNSLYFTQRHMSSLMHSVLSFAVFHQNLDSEIHSAQQSIATTQQIRRDEASILRKNMNELQARIQRDQEKRGKNLHQAQIVREQTAQRWQNSVDTETQSIQVTSFVFRMLPG